MAQVDLYDGCNMVVVVLLYRAVPNWG